MVFKQTIKPVLFATAASLALSCGLPTPAKADAVQQEIIQNVIRNILENIRDQIQRRRIVPPPGVMRFSVEDNAFDSRHPFAVNEAGGPFSALAYAKAPAMAVAPLPVWLYGFNASGSGDRTQTFVSTVHSATATASFDVTKIGIFTTSDALTFVATGSHTWSHQHDNVLGLVNFDSTSPSASGTLAYTNGGFSTDFTGTASWTSVTALGLVIGVPANSSSATYTGNVQYKYDLPYSFFFEPTVGVSYTETYTANFGTKTGDLTEVHGGARIGTEMKWMGFTIQPTLSGAVFKIVDFSPAVAASVSDQLGGRGSGKINVIWTPNFSSWIEAHGSGIAGTKTLGYVSSNTYGASGGVRYSW
jgi:hypothetical protein